MMTERDYDRLRKLTAMLASESDGEVLNAVDAISNILNQYGLVWSDLLLPRKFLTAQSLGCLFWRFRIWPKDSTVGNHFLGDSH